MKKNNIVAITIFLLFAKSPILLMGQCLDKEDLKGLAYRFLIRNFISYNTYQCLKNNDGNFRELLLKGQIWALDTNKYYPIYFKCLDNDTTIYGYSIIEFDINVNNVITINCGGLPKFAYPVRDGMPFFIRKGLIGYNIEKDKFIAISGNLFLDDTKAFFFEKGMTNENVSTYIRYRYYNLYPQNISKKKRNKVYFLSETTVYSGMSYMVYKNKYCLSLKKKKNKFYEKLRLIKSEVIEEYH